MHYERFEHKGKQHVIASTLRIPKGVIELSKELLDFPEREEKINKLMRELYHPQFKDKKMVQKLIK